MFFGDVRTKLGESHEEGRFGGVAHDLPGAVLGAVELGVIGDRAGHHRLAGLVAGHVTGGIRDRAGGIVAGPAKQRGAGGRDHLLQRHFVLGESTGLIGTNHAGRPQGFHRGQVLHHRIMFGKLLHPNGQHQRQDCRQPLGDGGNGQGHAQNEDLHHVLRGTRPVNEDQGRHDHNGDPHHQQAKHFRHFGDFLIERGLILLGVRQHGGDGTHLRVHAGVLHLGDPHAAHHRGALEHGVGALPQGRVVGHRLGGFMDGLGFAGERRLLNIQVGGLNEGCVRPHGVALGQEKHVAGNQVMGGDGLLFTVTHHGGIRGGHFRQSSHRVGGLRLLGVPQNSVSDHNDGDDNNINGRASGPLHDPSTQGNPHGDKQQVDEGVLELAEKFTPLRLGFLRA